MEWGIKGKINLPSHLKLFSYSPSGARSLITHYLYETHKNERNQVLR
jgi:hypothetical protein